MHDLDNVVVTDGSVFPTASGHNPTLTIMSVAWHSMEQFLGTATATPVPATTVQGERASQLPATGAKENVAGIALGATAAGLFARSAVHVTADRANTDGEDG
jgi:LPXTG-motif cell wall-anchored protein